MRIVFKPMGVALLVAAMSLVIGIVLLQQQQLQKTRQSVATTPPLPSKPIRAAEAGTLKEGVYRIRSVSSGLYLGTHNSSVDPKQEDHISQGRWYDKPNQKWRLLRLIDGTFNVQNTHQGFWLDNKNASTSSGDYVRQWYEVTRTTNDAQKWQIIPQGKDAYQVRNVMSGKVLEIHDNSKAPGAFAYQEEWKNADTQKFVFNRLAD